MTDLEKLAAECAREIHTLLHARACECVSMLPVTPIILRALEKATQTVIPEAWLQERDRMSRNAERRALLVELRSGRMEWRDYQDGWLGSFERLIESRMEPE